MSDREAAGRTVILGGNLVTPFEIIRDGCLLMSNGRISGLGLAQDYRQAPGDNVLDVSGCWVAPGFIDLLVHGASGHDVMDATQEALAAIAKDRLKSGTTSFLAGTRAATRTDTFNTLDAVSEYMEREPADGAQVLGIYLEGTFLGPSQKGAQPAEYISDALGSDREIYLRKFDTHRRQVKIVMVAPELPGACDFIRELRELGFIVAIGHTDASYEQALAAFRAGASHAVHTFNAMKGFTTRQLSEEIGVNERPGTLGAVLTEDGVTAEIIGDGIHVHPALIKVLIRCKGIENVILVTDNVRGCGMPEGWSYNIRGQDIVIQQGSSRLRNTQLAGCIARMNQLMKNMVQNVGIPVPEVIRMATANPARLLNLTHRKGTLCVGMDADVVVLDREFEVKMTIVRGDVRYAPAVHTSG
jgi:N-acetylglucosamine-6-phosphate deacetylase